MPRKRERGRRKRKQLNAKPNLLYHHRRPYFVSFFPSNLYFFLTNVDFFPIFHFQYETRWNEPHFIKCARDNIDDLSKKNYCLDEDTVRFLCFLIKN